MEYQDCDMSGVVGCNSPRCRVRSSSLPLISSVNSLDMFMLSPLFTEEHDVAEENIISSPKSSSLSITSNIAENPSISSNINSSFPLSPSSPNQRMRLLCEKYQSSSLSRSNPSCIPNQPCSLKALLMDDFTSSRSNSIVSGGNISTASGKHCPFHRHSTSDLFCFSASKFSDSSFNSSHEDKQHSHSPSLDDIEHNTGCTESEMAHMFFYFVLGIVMVIVQFAKKCFKDSNSTTIPSPTQTPIIVNDQSSSTHLHSL